MKKLLMISALVATVFASCSREDVEMDPTLAASKDKLNVFVGGIGTKAIKSTFAASDLIKVFINGTGYTPTATEYKFSTGPNAWTVNGSDKDIQLTGNPATVYAYAPSTLTASALTSVGTLPITIPTTDDFAATEVTDVLWATPIGGRNNATSGASNLANLQFNHALAKISFILVKDATYPSALSAGVLSSITLSSAGNKIVTTGTTRISDGFFTAGTKSGSVVYSGSTNINQAGNSAVIAYALVAPINYTGGDLVLTMTIDGHPMTVTGFGSSPDWSVASKGYQYTITVKPLSLSVSNTSIINMWTPAPTGSGITAQ